MGTRSEIQKSRVSQARGRLSNDPSNGSHLKGDLAQLVTKLQAMELEVSEERGEFELFGLVLRAASEDRWDIVVSARWFSQSREDELRYLSDKLTKALSPDELLKISRIVPMWNRDDFVQEMQKLIQVQHGLQELEDSEVSSIDVKRALIITSGRVGSGRLIH